MQKIAFILSLVISAQFFSQKTPIQLLPSGHIIAKATIDGKAGNFIFDTGGGINLFFYSFAKDLKQKTTYNFLTAFRATGEKIVAPIYQNDEVEFAGKKFKNIPYSTFNMNLKGIDGLISLQMFSDTDFIIDYNTKEIILSDLSKIKTSKVFDIQLSTNADRSIDIFTYILLSDQFKIQVLLDSGAGNDSFWLSEKLISTLQLDASKLELKEVKSEFDEKVV